MQRFLALCFLWFTSPGLSADTSWFTPTRPAEEPRNLYGRPLLSLFLPGFDQHLQGHVISGAAYSTVWVGSRLWSMDRADAWEKRQETLRWNEWTKQQQDDYKHHEDLPRQRALASQLMASAGAMSAWHSFRTVVETHRPTGRFAFLEQEETPMDLLTAPFEFSFLQRPTTWIPLLVAAGLGVLAPQDLPKDFQRDPFDASDAFYASAFSYNAGVSEEALFRGYLQPMLYDAWESPLAANSVQALLFALAHRSTMDRPFAQAGMGFYLGWLQEKRNWTLRESIFVHAWWDVLVLSSSYLVRLKDKGRRPPPVIWLPAFSILL